MTRAAWTSLLLAVLLGLLGVRLLHAAHQNAFTLDEPHYVGTGLYLWESGDYHFFRSLRFQPPLAFHLASVPLLFLDLPPAEPGPDLGRRLIAQAGPSLTKLRVASRLPFVLLCVYGGLLCFLWAREVGGPAAGLLAAFLYTTNPSILAHGSLVHSDLAIAVLTLQTLYLLWRWWKRPGVGTLCLCGASLGLAMLAKLNALLLIGAVFLLLGIAHLPRPVHAQLPPVGEGTLGQRAVQVLRAGSLIGGVALFVLWLGYGGSFALAAAADGPLAGVALPAWVQSYLFAEQVNRAGRVVFFLGEFATQGWWGFYPVAFAIKEPVGFVLLTLAAVASLAWRRQRLGLFLAAPVAIYLFILIVYVRVPLGYRYALTLLPLFCVFIATQLTPLTRGAPRLALLGLLALLAVESAWVHPHYLAHFNALVGGPASGHRYLLDANLDWGQDVTTLARELRARGNPPVSLALYAVEDPAAHGVQGRDHRGCDPVAGFFAISANVRMGLYRAGNPFARPGPDCYAWLDAYEPVAIPGGSIFLYELPPVTPTAPDSRAAPGPPGSPD